MLGSSWPSVVARLLSSMKKSSSGWSECLQGELQATDRRLDRLLLVVAAAVVPEELLELLNKAAARLELLLASEVLLLLAAVLLQLELLLGQQHCGMGGVAQWLGRRRPGRPISLQAAMALAEV